MVSSNTKREIDLADKNLDLKSITQMIQEVPFPFKFAKNDSWITSVCLGLSLSVLWAPTAFLKMVGWSFMTLGFALLGFVVTTVIFIVSRFIILFYGLIGRLKLADQSVD